MIKKFAPVEGRNAEIIETVLECPEVAGLDEELKFNIRLCVEEIEENILNYSGTTWIELTTSMENGMLSIGFRDGGVKFDPLAKEDPDISAALSERPIGGLGIFICKQIMTSIDYHFENGCNVIVMKLKI